MEQVKHEAKPGNGRSACSIHSLVVSGTLPSTALPFAAGDVIFHPDEPADQCFLIESGEARIYHDVSPHITRLLDIVGPEDLIGLAALGELPTYGKRAVAVTHCKLRALATPVLRREFLRNPDLAVNVIGSLASRLHQAWNAGSEQMYLDCNMRIIHALLRFSTSSAATHGIEGTILHITHAQLAQAVGAARETVSICITNLKKRKIIRTGRSRLVFDPARLAACA